MDHDAPATWQVGLRLFGLSFTALFLELMVIRWVPSEVRLVAYYANLMLVSSFLGLGLGAMVTSRGWALFRWFAPLLAGYVLFLLFPSIVELLGLTGTAQSFLPVGDGEWRFQGEANKTYAYLFLALIFVFNAVVFVPIGEEIGRQFHRVAALHAYSWDLGGSLAGTICFGAFSLLHFSPLLGMTFVAVVMSSIAGRAQLLRTLPFYLLALGAMLWIGDRGAWWSPYHFLSVTEMGAGPGPAGAPPTDVRTRRDPPIYTVHVNQDFYQLHGTIDTARYTAGTAGRGMAELLFDQYRVPYVVTGPRERVLVLGAGGGMDVEAALLHGATRVDAVEIDPLIPRLSDRFSAAAPYRNAGVGGRVALHIDDARAFLENAEGPYDLVVLGFLDSQALFSYGASLRLDGYTYTVESFRRAFKLLDDDGAMAVSFFAGRPWMLQKLVQMLETATGIPPTIYFDNWKAVLVTTKAAPDDLPVRIGRWQLARMERQPVELATDDWPYLYLERQHVPRDYAIVIGVLLLVSVATVGALRGRGLGASDAHFFFMGWGFLLLQTKSIGDTSLYFGTTWFVTTLVITGVLLMVLLANWVAIRFLRVRAFSPWLYLPLFASLALLLLVPRETILGQHYGVRLVWTLVAVPLPVFFAGLIFSTTFRDAANPSSLFGANLMGATIGGFSEYLGMWTGSEALSVIVIVAYLASLLSVRRARRHGVLAGALGLLLLPAALPAQPLPERGALTVGTVAITDVTVIPMTADTVLRAQTVVIRDGRIVEVGPASRVRVPADATRIAGRGRYLIPGLADTHTHLFSDGELPDAIAPAELGVMLANGVTAARLMIGTPEQLTLRQQVADGRVLGPQLWVASPQFAGRPQENGVTVATAEDARAAVRQAKADGYDAIKLTFFITPEVYEAVTSEAKSHGLPVVGHVEPSIGVERALAAGQQIEHLDAYLEAALADSAPSRESLTQGGLFRLQNWRSMDHVDDRKLDALAGATARAGVWSGPTLNVFNDAFAGRPDFDEISGRAEWHSLPPSWRALYFRARTSYWREANAQVRTPERRARYIAARNRLVRAIVDSGGKLLAGSDTPEWFHLYGHGLHRELQSFVAAGLTPYQALAAATSAPAEYLGAGADWGTVAVGRRADLVLLRNNPLEDIRHTTAIDGVMIGGRWIPRDELDAMLAAGDRALQPQGDTLFLEVGAPQVDGRIYRPHKARVQVRLGAPDGPVVSEWTNELTLGDSAGRAVARWITIGTQMPVNGPRSTWEIRQTFDARTLQPLAYHRTGSAGGMMQLALEGTRVHGSMRQNATADVVAIDRTLDRPGYVASASDLVPLAAPMFEGAVMVAPFWGPQMTATEKRIFNVVRKEKRMVEGTEWEAWRVEERRYSDHTLVATWFLVDRSPYMVAGEVPMANGQVRYMTEIAIP